MVRIKIPELTRVVDFLDKTRQDRIGEVLDILKKLKESLIYGSFCTEDCDTWHLGALEQCLWRGELYPRPTEPFSNISISGTHNLLDSFRQVSRNGRRMRHSDSKACGFPDSWFSRFLEVRWRPVCFQLK